MAIPHGQAGEPINMPSLSLALPPTKTTTVIKTMTLGAVRLVVPAGKAIPTHQVAGEITVQCLEGRIAFTAGDTTRELGAGELLYLTGNQPRSLRGTEDASVLVTLLLH